MKRAIWLGVCLGLGMTVSACTTEADRAAEQARLEAIDNRDCNDLGFQRGSDAYGNCRLKLKEIRAKQQAQQSPNVNFGFGVGVAKGF